MAQRQFGQLSYAESALLASAESGGLAFLGASPDLADPTNDPANANVWHPARTLRASLVKWLCSDPTARQKVTAAGISICGAQVIEQLDLSHLTIPFSIRFLACNFLQSLIFYSTSIAELDLRASWLPALTADCIDVKGSVLLSNKLKTHGEVRLAAAQIGIDVTCQGSSFLNEGKTALNADGANIKRNVFLHDRFVANGLVRFSNATIGGNLECDTAIMTNAVTKDAPQSGISLHAERIKVGGYIFLRAITAKGAVFLPSAEIGASIECDSAVIENPFQEGAATSGTAIAADGVAVKGSLNLNRGFCARGEVRLRSASIGGNLDCEGAALSSPSRMALDADRAKIGGYVFLRNGFSAEGEIKLLNATVGSNLECGKARLRNPIHQGNRWSGKALNADNIKVGGYVFLRENFEAEGEVTFLNAEIGSEIECNGAKLRNCEETTSSSAPKALCLSGARIRGGLILADDFLAIGEVEVCEAQIGGKVICHKAAIQGKFMAQSTVITGGLFWTEIVNPELTKLDLVNTHIGALVDDARSWPSLGNLRIDGLTYERLSGRTTPKSADERLEWLGRQEAFAPQPYRQVAKILAGNGDDLGARRVLCEMERRRRKHECSSQNRWLRSGSAFWSTVLRATVGYGFHPARSLWYLAALTALCSILFEVGYWEGSLAPTGTQAYEQFTTTGTVPPNYEHFNAFMYSLENSFPLVRFGQAETWRPALDPKWKYPASPGALRLASPFVSPWSLRCIRWIQISLGWFLATMGLAAVTGIVRKL